MLQPSEPIFILVKEINKETSKDMNVQLIFLKSIHRFFIALAASFLANWPIFQLQFFGKKSILFQSSELPSAKHLEAVAKF